jgi:hypothetical protein
VLLKLAVGAVGFVGLIVLVLFLLYPPVVIARRSLIKLHPWKFQSIPLAELSCIQFHYDAVMGFRCVWEFISKSGRKMFVEANDIDDKLLANLERNLDGFSKQDFYAEFKDGDVEDTIGVWYAPKH